MQRRDFIKYLGCGCCAIIAPSCTSTPITQRKQLKIYPESTINANAAKAYSAFKKSKNEQRYLYFKYDKKNW